MPLLFLMAHEVIKHQGRRREGGTYFCATAETGRNLSISCDVAEKKLKFNNEPLLFTARCSSEAFFKQDVSIKNC